MCGIAGIIGADPEWQRVLPRMLQALQHRGPDGEGRSPVRAQPSATAGCRSSTSPAGTSRSPTRIGRCWSIFNGEIYNYRELRARARAARPSLPHRQRHARSSSTCTRSRATRASSACAACSPSRSGTTRADGSFARATSSGRSRFYYARAAGEFRCSPPRSRRCSRSSRRCGTSNRGRSHQYLALRLICAAAARCFEGIHKLPPAHKLVLRAGARARDLGRYWDLAYEPKLAGSDEALTDELERTSRKLAGPHGQRRANGCVPERRTRLEHWWWRCSPTASVLGTFQTFSTACRTRSSTRRRARQRRAAIRH